MTRLRNLLIKFFPLFRRCPGVELETGTARGGRDPTNRGISGRQLVEFVRGPFDGYREYVDADQARQCMSYVSLPVSRAAYTRLEGKQPHALDDEPTSLAIYELCAGGRVWYYQFCRQVSSARRPISKSKSAKSDSK
jgi:hypothetical protein